MTLWVWLISCSIGECLIEAVGIWFRSNSFDVADETCSGVLSYSDKPLVWGLKNRVWFEMYTGVVLEGTVFSEKLVWTL